MDLITVLKILAKANIKGDDNSTNIRRKIEKAGNLVFSDVFNLNWGCYKYCLSWKGGKKVIKWQRDTWDTSIERERKIYLRAIQNNVDAIVPRTEKVLSVNGIFFYVQDRVYITEDNLFFWDEDEETNEKLRNTIIKYYANVPHKELECNSYLNRASYHWKSAIIAVYGLAFYQRVADFVRDNRINDLHECNIGYMENGNPMFIDFSGAGMGTGSWSSDDSDYSSF